MCKPRKSGSQFVKTKTKSFRWGPKSPKLPKYKVKKVKVKKVKVKKVKVKKVKVKKVKVKKVNVKKVKVKKVKVKKVKIKKVKVKKVKVKKVKVKKVKVKKVKVKKVMQSRPICGSTWKMKTQTHTATCEIHPDAGRLISKHHTTNANTMSTLQGSGVPEQNLKTGI
jgi:hypothetical protein